MFLAEDGSYPGFFRKILLLSGRPFCYSGKVRLPDKFALPSIAILLLAGVGFWSGSVKSTSGIQGAIQLRQGLSPDEKMTAYVDARDLPKAFRMYSELTGRELIPSRTSWTHRLDRQLNGRLVRWGWVKPSLLPDTGICFHRDGRFSAVEIKQELEELFQSAGLKPMADGKAYYRLVRSASVAHSSD
jgi:hypothetical protein